MSPHRSRRSLAQLRESYDETLDALRRRFEQLKAAVVQFEPDLDERTLQAAWDSDDPLERNRAGGVLANFEKTYMLSMDLVALSVKIAGRLGAVEDADVSPLEVLRERGVLSRETEAALVSQRDVRNTSQHIYVELSVSELRSAVLEQLETTPRTIRDVTVWVESLEAMETSPEQ
ncbi:MAG TPA: hypothetical protein VHS55_00735 [Solirubrobacteraceae bacterium]|nr:hypothetical protein [Solirubrobacteraceae bacterium]